MKETLINIAKAIVDHPDAVNVLESEEGNKVTLVLNVAESDMGMVIGKGGKIAKAIRTLMRAAASADGKEVSVVIR
ncbi:MAG: KH domain-containing protein [Clostridia bacterium]|nr:KH domain-containing protein [Clostridia bacterium]MBQ8818168.1 KH domain-containing protein [Clostridia bacterium]MBR4014001.1 KH domain-containing protein [Clostridia bacterium]